MKNKVRSLGSILQIIIGSALFGAGFNMFMVSHDMNAGGLSGLSMILVHLLDFGTVGTLTILINIPLFVIGGWTLGKRFFFLSLIGMLTSSVSIDVLSILPVPEADPLVAALYGGVLCGLGFGHGVYDRRNNRRLGYYRALTQAQMAQYGHRNHQYLL